MATLSGTKPNFFILGAPKCGTTALAYYLSTHPDVHFASPKEAHFFHTDFARGHRLRFTLEEFFAVFDPEEMARATAAGEATVWYLFSETAVPEILRLNPDALFLVMVRDPIDLAHSLHAQMLYGGEENEPSFERAWRLQEDRRQGRSLPPAGTDWRSTQYGPVARVGEQLERLFERVPRERVHVVVFDDLRDDPGQVYRQVLAFLGLPDDGRRDFPTVNESRRLSRPGVARVLQRLRKLKLQLGLHRSLGIWSALSPWLSRRAKRAPLDPALRAEMADYFRDDVERLARLLGRDLSHWARAGDRPRPSHAEGGRPDAETAPGDQDQRAVPADLRQ